MILLLIIYLAFISLGLPDALLGASWTVMHLEIGASIELAGAIAMVISGGTIISSLLSTRAIRKFGTGKVVVVSVAMTAIALLGFSISSAIWMIVIFAIPLGLGAGAVDASLNNFVALHYKQRHMNWLHCFWGVGASAGPLILGYLISRGGTWRNGYATVGILQFALVTILVISLPLWHRFVSESSKDKSENGEAFITNQQAFRIKGVKFGLLTFLFYCSLEAGTGLWAASYLTTQRGITPTQAAFWTSLYYGGITVGRFLSGVIAEKIQAEQLIRGGVFVILLGIMVLIAPLPSNACILGLILIGLGCAPIYPSMIHLTPARFGKTASQSVIALSMACAYVGSTFAPPVIGALAAILGLNVLPFILMIFAFGMLVSSEYLRKRITYKL